MMCCPKSNNDKQCYCHFKTILCQSLQRSSVLIQQTIPFYSPPMLELSIPLKNILSVTRKMSTSSYLLVSAEVMAMSGGVRSGSVVGRGGTVTVSDSGLRSQ